MWNLNRNWQMMKWWVQTARICLVKPQWSEPKHQVFLANFIHSWMCFPSTASDKMPLVANSTVSTVRISVCSWSLMLMWWVSPIDSGILWEGRLFTALLWTLISLLHAHTRTHWRRNSSRPRGVYTEVLWVLAVRKQPWSSSLTAS